MVNDVNELLRQAKARGIYRENPKLATQPSWVTDFRPHQRKAIEEILEAFKEVDLVFLDAPTGAGKTLIGETVSRLLGDEQDAVYICHSKNLQDQFLADFPDSRVIKGKSNYWPDGKEGFTAHGRTITCDECDKQWCTVCPYGVDKAEAISSGLAVLNSSYFLAECNGPGRFRNRSLVVADEADTLEREMMGFVEIAISPFRMKKYKWDPPKRITVKESWVEWCNAMIRKADQERLKYPYDLSTITDVREKKEAQWLENLAFRLEILNEGLANDTWVYDGSKKDQRVQFKPVVVNDLGDRFLWRHGKKWLLMSATLISSSEMAESLGWFGDYATVSVPSTFPKQNRLVKVKPVALMTKKANTNGEETVKLLDSVVEIVASHPNEKILIHTVSYNLAHEVFGFLSLLKYGKRADVIANRALFTYGGSYGGRDSETERWKADKTPSIMVAPSLDRGVDLPGDLCRVQIIAKVPFPFMGDKQVSTRLFSKGGQNWYDVQTVRTIVQMTGRAVRNEKDSAVCYIIDKSFEGLYNSKRRHFPKWWQEAVVWERD